MNYLLEQNVAELNAKVKRFPKKRRENCCSLSPDDLLPNHRIAEKCCANCWFYDADYEGIGNCRILVELYKIFENLNIFISSYVSDVDLCDYWEKKQ